MSARANLLGIENSRVEFYDYLFGQERKYGEIRHITLGAPVDPN